MRGCAWSTSVLALTCILAAAAAAVALVIALPVEPPPVLRSANPAASIPVTHRSFADERQVQLALDTGAPRAVVTARSGIVTALACTVGGDVHSGAAVAAIDAVPVIAIATSTPLWRDLAPGDRGADVRGLQSELARLGSVVPVDGAVGPLTMRAARAFLEARGVPAAELDEGVVPVAAFAWVPAPTVSVKSCDALVGAPLPDGGTLMQLPAELRAARIEPLPSGASLGDRDVGIGPATFEVDGDGVLADPTGLAALAGLPEYGTAIASTEGAPTLSVMWRLRRPIDIDVVPPTALWDVEAGAACVQPVVGDAIRVEVVGSELGQAFVRADALSRTFDHIRATPDRGRSCR